MLNISEDAMAMCHATIIQLSDSQSHSKCLRFKQDTNQALALAFDNPRKSDEIIRHNGVAVFALPEKLVGILSDMTLDIDENGRLTVS